MEVFNFISPINNSNFNNSNVMQMNNYGENIGKVINASPFNIPSLSTLSPSPITSFYSSNTTFSNPIMTDNIFSKEHQIKKNNYLERIRSYDSPKYKNVNLDIIDLDEARKIYIDLERDKLVKENTEYWIGKIEFFSAFIRTVTKYFINVSSKFATFIVKIITNVVKALNVCINLIRYFLNQYFNGVIEVEDINDSVVEVTKSSINLTTVVISIVIAIGITIFILNKKSSSTDSSDAESEAKEMISKLYSNDINDIKEISDEQRNTASLITNLVGTFFK